VIDIDGFVHKLRADLDRLLRIIIVHPDKVQIRANIETPVEGYVGPSSTAGIYFKSGSVGIATTAPEQRLTVVIDSTSNAQGIAVKAYQATGNGSQPAFTWLNNSGTKKWAQYLNVADSSLNINNGSTDCVTILTGGNVGIATTAPTAPLSVSEKCAMNSTGGFMVKLTNKTGGNSVKGEVVTTDSTTNNAVKKIVVDVPNPIGVFFESGIADGAEAWVVVSGIADVYFVGNTTRGHIARGFETADGASYVTGQAMSEAVPTSPFSVDKHFYEMGHVLETRTGAGLSKVVLHFN
jgi:hypothetical protein